MLLTAILLASALAADDPCLPPRNAGSTCSDRIGRCFDVEIDGQRVEPLDDPALSTELTKKAGYHAVCWTLPKPTHGDVDIAVKANGLTPRLGELRPGHEVVVTALEGQKVPTHKGIRTDPTVMIGGVPMQTVVDVIDSKALPAGAYVVRVRVLGSNGRDDKSIYVHVERPKSAAH